MDGAYWEQAPTADPRPAVVPLRLPDLSLDLTTATGVFAAQRVDRGTLALLRHAPGPDPYTSVLDLGSGYGPIAVTLARREPSAGVWAVDVNERALELTRANAAGAGASNVAVAAPMQVPDALRFDGLYSNPPIKIGKDELHELLSLWLARLVPGAPGWLVVKQSMGADALHSWLTGSGYPTQRAASKQGYRLLQVQAPATAGPPRKRIDPADLALVNRQTRTEWTVLGHLAGGASDQVYLLGQAQRRAVLKIKQGAWWAEQLVRMAETVPRLRAVGYPTPPVLASGRLDEQRCCLLTEYQPGRSRARLSPGALDQVLDAVERQAQVHPSPVRDWSTMVTAFLNGGIAEFAFHPRLLPLAERALGLITRPVPALPTGDFVHGDFTPRNLLFRRDGLAAVIDVDGFGTGTRVIDLVALLQTAAHPRYGDPTMARRLADHAIAVDGADTFAACVAHRVLAALAAATEHPDQRRDAQERCAGLLRLLG